MTDTRDKPQRRPSPPPIKVRSERAPRTDTTDRAGPPAAGNPFEEDLETAVLLSDDDIESIEMMEISGVVEQETDPRFAQQSASEPSVIVDHEPGTATADDVNFFYREALAIGAQQPERSGIAWFEAAQLAQLARSPQSTTLQYLEAALKQAPDNPALISLVRREMVRLRQHDRALELTAKLVQAGAGQERVAALIEAAGIQRNVKNDAEAALGLLRQALTLQPGNAGALSMIASYTMELGQHEGAAEALEQLAEVLSSDVDRSACLQAAGTLRELRLDQRERAEQDYTRALELDGDNLPAWISRAYLHLEAGAWHRLSQDLEQIATRERGNDLRVGCLVRAGLLHIHRNEDLEAAARMFDQAAEVAPETAPLSRLAQVHEATGRMDRLVETLRRLLDLTLDTPGRAVLLMRIGHLLELKLDRVEEAVETYRQALEAKPGHFPALQALGAVFRRQCNFSSLLEILLPEAEGSGDPARRAMRCVEVGGILADRLGRPADAIEFYRRALELDPELRLAAWRLGSLLLGQGRFVELAKLLEWQVEHTTDERSRFHLLVELARVQKGPLEAPEQALETLKRAWQIGQNRIAAMELLELYDQTGHYSELVEMLLWEADQTEDVGESIWRRIEAAMVLEDRLEEHERALSIFWQVLEQQPTCVGAIRAAGQIYYAHRRWQELIKLHMHELEHEPELGESAEPWCRIGRIHEEHLGQHEDAIEAYKKALELDSTSTVALDALERLIRIEQRYEELVPVLESYARRRPEPHAAADILCRAAELADARLNEAERGARLYREALGQHPQSALALYGLSDIQIRQGKYDEACASLRRLVELMGDAESQCLLTLQQARLTEFRLGRIDPAPYDFMAKLTKLAPRVRLDQLRTRLTSDNNVAAAQLVAGATTEDNLFGSALLGECAQRCEWNNALDAQREAAWRGLTRNREDRAVAWALQRALRATGEWDKLAALLETEAVGHRDPAVRVSLLTQAARAQLAAEAPQESARLFGVCLDIDKQHLPSIRGLIQLASEWRNYTELASLLDQLASTCVDRENRLDAALRAADCWSEQVGDPVNALASLKRVLAEDPQQADAFARAWRLLTTLGDYGQLSQLYARRIGACEDPEQKAQLLGQHVRLLRDQLGDTPGAIAELNSLLELRPDDVEALQSLADLSQAAKRWADAADALSRLAERTDDAEQRRRARLAHASIALKQLQRPREALTLLQGVLQEDPASLEAKRLLVEVHVEEGQWEEAQRLLDEVTAEGDPELQVWAWIQLAEVARVGLRNEAMQQRYEQQALTLAADRPALLTKVVEHYRQHRRQKRLLEQATRLDLGSSNTKAAARLHLIAARLLLEDFNQPDRAIEHLRESLAIEPKNVEANLLMGEALEHRGEIDGAVDAYRKLLADSPACVEAYRGLNRLMGVLGKPALATAAAAVLDLLGESTPAERGQVKTLDQLNFPPGRLSLGALPLRPMLKPVVQTFDLVAPHLGPVYPMPQQVPLEDGAPATRAVRRLARVLGLSEVTVSVEGDEPARAGVGLPAGVRLNAQLARQPDGPIFRFWVGRALAEAVTAGALLARLPNRELDELIEALFAQRPEMAAQQLRKQLGRAVPRRVRKQLEQQRLDPVDSRLWDRYRADEQRRCDVIGMLICGNPKVAVAELAATTGVTGSPAMDPRLRDMMTFAVTDRYAVLHAAIWTRPPSQP